MKIMYRTGGWKELIETVEVERETDSSVWIKGRRNLKMSNYDCYWETMDEAKEYLSNHFSKKIERRELELSSLKDKLNLLDNY